MCILLYVKPIWFSGIPVMYGLLEEGGLGSCAFCYMLNLFGLVVFHRAMINWRRGPWYMCILLYVKPIWCSGILYMYGCLEGKMCLRYMVILLYVKLI